MQKIYDYETLKDGCKNAKSFREMCINIGAPLSGNGYQRIRQLINQFKIDISHFHINREKCKTKNVLHNDHKFRVRGSRLKTALVNSGIEYKCQECNIKEWNDKQIVLHVDHIDGVATNCNIDNLRFLCPNCHSQTYTYCNKNESTPRCNYCIDCRKKIKPSSKRCKRCCNKFISLNNRKVKNRPSLELLLSEVEEMGYCATGRKYGVSDNAVRKWIKKGKMV